MFKRHDFNTPKTVRITHQEGAKFAMDELRGVGVKYPVILKSAVGSRGIGVMWIESEKALYGFVQLLYREDPYIDILLQEWIKTPYDVRVIVMNGQVLGSMKRTIISDDFRSNVSLGSKATAFELTELEEKNSLTAAKAVDGQLVGVDFIPAKDRNKEQPYILEVNSMPGFGGIEEVHSGFTSKILKNLMNRDNWT